MNHPMIMEIERAGYPLGYEERDHYGVDALGNEVMTGDEILLLNDEFFLVDVLAYETIHALEIVGADRGIAE